MAEEKQPAEEPKKEKPASCPLSAPFWMVTYSDMVTLLLTFFVLLLSMANMDPKKAAKAANSIQEAFGMHATSSKAEFVIPILPSNPATPYSPISQMTVQKVYDKVRSQIESMRLDKSVGVLDRDDESIILRINDSVLFDKGQAKISREAYPVLRSIAEIIRPLPMDLRIEGHTDDIPYGDSQMGNWDLSVARAVSVMRFYQQAEEFPLDRMAATGYGKSRPVAANTDEISKAKNRRVDFVLRLKSAGKPGRQNSDGIPM